MPDFAVDWVDAFTSTPMGGNGCAVVHDDGALSDADCMRFVRETSLVECTFVGRSDKADFRVRYFLASREIPFAGHPTIATAASLAHRGLIKASDIVLETRAGLVPVRITTDTNGANRYAMTQIAPEFGTIVDPELVAAVGGLAPDEIIAPPQHVSTGLPFVITVLRDHESLRRARLNPEALAHLTSTLGYDGSDLMEPFWVTLTGATAQGDTFSRLCLAPPSPAEDPFTGSATGAMAAYLWHHGLMTRPQFVAEQGHWLDRPGQAFVERLGDADHITGVRVEGSAHVLISGTLHL